MDIAKTQWKLHQFELKEKLKRLLNKRSTLREDGSPELKADLDLRIKQIRDHLDSNKCMLVPNK